MENHCGCWACHDINGTLTTVPCGPHCTRTWEITMTTLVNARTAAEAFEKVTEQLPWPMKSMGARRTDHVCRELTPQVTAINDRTPCPNCGGGYRQESVVSVHIPHNDKCPVNDHTVEE